MYKNNLCYIRKIICVIIKIIILQFVSFYIRKIEILCHHKNTNFTICVIIKILILQFVSFYIRNLINFVSS